MTRRQKAIVAVAALACATSRFLAVARSLWDWDEALFTLAMRDYDVTLHHPHPPGFPAYIAMARVARFFADSDFHALQTVNVIASLFVFPAVFFLARELRLRFETSVIAGVLFAFFPNVWFFGGGAFSDVPSIVLVCFAAALLLRGAQNRNAYWLGTLLLAIAMGIRPQNFLIGLVPGLYASKHRKWHEILVALLIGVVICGAAFGGAIYASGDYANYMRVVREHADYISRVDSWRSPDRPPLWRLFDRFFFKQYQSPVMSVIVSLLVLVSVIRSIQERYRPMLWNALIFGPFALFAWVMLDRFSISRFSIGYIPMFALFAADGIRRVTQNARPRFELILATLIVLGFIVYTLPGLNVVRTTVAPSVLAAEKVSMTITPKDTLYVGHTMSKFVDVFAPRVPYRRVIDDRALPMADVQSAWLLAEVTETKPEGFFFQRERGHLWNIARRHYFEIVLRPLKDRARFVSGWYPVETHDIHEWRWMSERSVTILPPRAGSTVLRMHIDVPGEIMPRQPEITMRLNGAEVDRFKPDSTYFERNVHVSPAPGGRPNVLEMSITHTHQDGAQRHGMRVRYLAWGPA